MKVKLLKTGAIADFNDSYARRLIEQGKATLPPKVPAKKAEVQPAKKAEAGK